MSSHENKTFRSRSVVKQKGMVFGFRKTATAVTRPERYIDRSHKRHDFRKVIKHKIQVSIFSIIFFPEHFLF